MYTSAIGLILQLCRTIAEYAREIWGVEPTYEKLPDAHAGKDGSPDQWDK